jgi:hypothetical protein
MNILILGPIVLLSSFLIQIILWRANIIKNKNVKNIVLIFFITALSFYFLIRPSYSFITLVQGSIVYLLSILVYLSLHTAVEKDSPSSLILLSLASHKDGVSLETLSNLINDDEVLSRLHDLENNSFTRIDNKYLSLTRRGQILYFLIKRLRLLFTKENFGG